MNSLPKLKVVEKQIRFPDSLKRACKQYPLSYLLPYDVNTKIQGHLSYGLKEYKMLLISARDAIQEFLSGNLSSFDSLVGENACQIRATLLALIAKHFPSAGKHLLKKICFLIKKIDSTQTLPEGKQVLGQYLDEHELGVKINSRELFLISSYILTRVRVLLPPDPSRQVVRNESTNTKKVKEISNVSSTFSRELVKKLRSLLSKASVKFVQDIADILPIPEPVVDMVSDEYCLSHDKFGRLSCLPCFWYTFILLKYSVEINLPIILKVKQIATDKNHKQLREVPLYFKVSQGRYQEIPPQDLSPEESALVIFASCCRKASEFSDINQWKNELLVQGLFEIILAYAAAHRQYPDEKNDVLIAKSNCDLYHYYKSKSLEWGCSLKNPSLFFLVHAYCDKVKNIF